LNKNVENSTAIEFPGFIHDTQEIGHVCVDRDVQVPIPLFRRYICHLHPDRSGRRKRKPKTNCLFAQVGIRGTEMMRQAIDNFETNLGFPLDDIDINKITHNVMHQGIMYGDENGNIDYTSGYYCGQPADRVGYKWYGWVCQDPEQFVNAYKPISNDTVALDNWFPKQYNLVNRKFDCDRMWRAENIVAVDYDSCTHPETTQSYRLAWRNCHSYVDEVVAQYDKLELDETKQISK